MRTEGNIRGKNGFFPSENAIEVKKQSKLPYKSESVDERFRQFDFDTVNCVDDRDRVFFIFFGLFVDSVCMI